MLKSKSIPEGEVFSLHTSCTNFSKNSGAPAKPIKVNYCSDVVKGGKMEKEQTS